MGRQRTVLNPNVKLDTNKYDVITCKQCFRNLKRYAVGFDLDGKHRIWVDETGRRYNGKTCPRCLEIDLRLRRLEKQKDKQASLQKKEGTPQTEIKQLETMTTDELIALATKDIE